MNQRTIRIFAIVLGAALLLGVLAAALVPLLAG